MVFHLSLMIMINFLLLLNILKKKLKNLVDGRQKLSYNAKLQGYISERRVFDAENISAQKASQKKRTRLQKDNVNF